MTTFALVHGSWHGAWCWELLTPLLEQGGHEVVAVELPSHDPSVSFDGYAEVVCAALDVRDDVVLVGHSMAGHTIPLVAARRPVRHLVYLCAVVPEVGCSLADQMRDDVHMLNPMYAPGLSEPDAELRQRWVDHRLAQSVLFGDCADDVAHAAIERLRPQALYPLANRFALDAFPATPCTYVVCNDDSLVNPDWSRRVARDRLGADVVEMPGSHSPFLSRPAQLADVLSALANDP